LQHVLGSGQVHAVHVSRVGGTRLEPFLAAPWLDATAGVSQRSHLPQRHVVEHIYDLHSFLDEVHRVVKPIGLFYVSLPCYNSIFVKNDPDWIGLYPQQHFWHFTEKTLTSLMKMHGVKLADIAIVRSKNYLPVESRTGVLYPTKIAVKKLINLTVKTFKLGDLIDAFYQAA
jgi:hypothetical protein